MHALFTIESTQKLWADLATRLGAIPDPLVQILDADGNAEDGDGGDDVVAPARGAVDARPPGHAEPAGRLLLAAAAGRHHVVHVDAVLRARAARRRPRAGRAQRPLIGYEFCAAYGLCGKTMWERNGTGREE